MLDRRFVVMRGGGDIASGIAVRLQNAGFRVVILETANPSAIRRKVAFAEAVYENEVFIEGIYGRLAKDIDDAIKITANDVISVLIDSDMSCIKYNKPYILVDAILAKKNIGTYMDMASIVIGVGPGFTAGLDVNAVIESNRGHNLGKVIFNGPAEPNTGIPGNIGGYTEERVIRALAEGKTQVVRDIGSLVEAGDTVAVIDGVEIKTKLKGVIRGMIREGYYANVGMKIGDVDPRSNVDNCFSVSDKARAIGGGVLEAILYLHNKHGLRNPYFNSSKEC